MANTHAAQRESTVDKIWLKSYPEGVPAEADINAYRSIREILTHSCQSFGDRPAFSNMGRTLTYAQLDRLTLDFAGYLRGTLGLIKGDRVAVMMPNILQYPVAIFGILRAGLTVVNTNPMYTHRELEHQLKDSGAKAIVIVENCAKILESVQAQVGIQHIITTQIFDLHGFPGGMFKNFVVKNVKKMIPEFHLPQAVGFNSALAAGRTAVNASNWREPDLSHNDLAFLQYTGGTTGVPKGAMLTHGNIVANLQQVSAWICRDLTDGRETVVTALPLYHIFALTVNCLSFMKIGAHNVFVTDPRNMAGFVKILKETPFTVLTGVNTLFAALMNNAEFAQLNFSKLKLAVGGGMAVQRAVAERWKQMTNVALLEGYGLTETSPSATMNPLNVKDFTGTIGLPMPSTIITIRDDDCNVLPLGVAGEICIQGPQVMAGYWQKPEETAKVMTPDGAFRSGDIGIMAETGFIKIVDRKKDMILVSGFNVYPNEVEDVIASHPGVLEVCAVSAPDEKSGEIVRVVIVKRDPSLTKQEIMEHCKKHLTGYKLPKVVEFWKELPKSNVGKILRKDVRDNKGQSSTAAAA